MATDGHEDVVGLGPLRAQLFPQAVYGRRGELPHEPTGLLVQAVDVKVPRQFGDGGDLLKPHSSFTLLLVS